MERKSKKYIESIKIQYSINRSSREIGNMKVMEISQHNRYGILRGGGHIIFFLSSFLKIYYYIHYSFFFFFGAFLFILTSYNFFSLNTEIILLKCTIRQWTFLLKSPKCTVTVREKAKVLIWSNLYSLAHLWPFLIPLSPSLKIRHACQQGFSLTKTSASKSFFLDSCRLTSSFPLLYA